MSTLPLKFNQAIQYISTLIDSKLQEIDDDRLWYDLNEAKINNFRLEQADLKKTQLQRVQQQENIKLTKKRLDYVQNSRRQNKEKAGKSQFIDRPLPIIEQQRSQRCDPFNPKKVQKIILPIKFSDQMLDRNLDLLFRGFSNNFLTQINKLTFEKIILNQCYVLAIPDFLIYPPINLHYLNHAKSSTKKSRTHIAKNHLHYMSFLRKCYSQNESSICIEGSLVVKNQKLLVVKYQINLKQGFYFRKEDTFDVLPQFPKFIADADLMEDFLFNLELDDCLQALKEQIKTNGRIIIESEKLNKNSETGPPIN